MKIMARPSRWQATLEASIEEACLAVRLYNDPAESRSFEGFVIHMHIAWLYLLHAEFIQDGTDYRYWDGKRLAKVDGEVKYWELKKSSVYRWPNENDPVRANLKLFIGLRNRLEHRHARSDSALLLNFGSYSHAMLNNFEEELTSKFGEQKTLAFRLRIPLFIGTFNAHGEQTLRRLRQSLPSDLAGFLANYESGLDSAITNDPRYQIRLRASLELATNNPDALAIQFLHLESLTDEERAAVEKSGREGLVISRNRERPVSGYGRLMPKKATEQVSSGIPFVFKLHHFIGAWKIGNVRPRNGDPDPSKTNSDFCEYDEPTKTYRYTEAYVKHLIKNCKTPEGFQKMTGQPAHYKP